MNPRIHLILGGARSGKSQRGELLAAASGRPVTYVATYASDPTDAEMQTRIQRHRAQRPLAWHTIENRFDLQAIFQEAAGRTVLLDCLTLWLSFHCESTPEPELLARLEDALKTAREARLHLILVSNELGMGLVPASPEGRAFRDLCGRANQLVARLADSVELVAAGLPLSLKGGAPP